jgi:hypothetical protein
LRAFPYATLHRHNRLLMPPRRRQRRREDASVAGLQVLVRGWPGPIWSPAQGSPGATSGALQEPGIVARPALFIEDIRPASGPNA